MKPKREVSLRELHYLSVFCKKRHITTPQLYTYEDIKQFELLYNSPEIKRVLLF